MAHLTRPRTMCLCWLALAGLLSAGGCGKKESKAPTQVAGRSPLCELDQAREYQCEELLPRESSKPAPEPYASCPAFLDQLDAVLGEPPSVAEFDVPYTRYTRKRSPPGHACCYSWCSSLEVVDPASVDPLARCTNPRAFREEFCIDRPESGSSHPAEAPEPWDRCPAALIPPAGAVFSRPDEGALFDVQLTAQLSREGFERCCYAWCSVAPSGVPVPQANPREPAR